VQRQLFDLLRRTVPRVPAHVAMGLAVITGGITYRTAGTMRATAHHNMAGLLGLPEDDRRIRRAALGAFCTLARNYVDMLAVPTLNVEQMLQRTEAAGMERLLAAQARGRGVLIATAHIGNVDAAGHAILVRGARCAVLTERVEPDWLFDFFVEERRHFGGEVLPMTANVLPLVQRALRNGQAVGIACDWDMHGTGVPVRLPGFSHAIRIPAAIAMLALRGKVPIIPIWPQRLADGRTRACIRPEIDLGSAGNLRADVRRICTDLAQQLLPRLRANPEHWVLFHRVWEVPTGDAAGEP
jgi:Kdo2-lipid IVA lauroyltransferase/acyltransferase